MIENMSENRVDTIGKEYTFIELAKFVALPVISRLVISLLQTLDDGLFISRYCGKLALAAFAICLPLFMLTDCFGMIVSGVSVSASTKMGEKRKEEAKSDFTTMCVVAFTIGVILSFVLWLFKDAIISLLGATELTRPYLSAMLDIMKFNVPFGMVTYVLNRFYVIAGRPKFSAVVTTVHTVSNFLFDYIFIVKMNLGVAGTAYANLIGNIIVDLIGVVFFLDKNKEMCFGKMNKNVWPTIKESFKFGKVDAFTSLALAANTFITNKVLLSLSSEDFVAAFTIVNNVQFMFAAAFFGLFGATNPLISYAYGEKNKDKLAKIIKQNAMMTLILSTIICAIYLFSKNIIMDIYMINGESNEIRALVSKGMNVTPFAFFFFGYNVMTQFVALGVNNDKVSTILTVIENVICSNIITIILPNIFGVDSTWYIFLIAEVLTAVASTIAIIVCADKYGYGKNKIATELEKD